MQSVFKESVENISRQLLKTPVKVGRPVECKRVPFDVAQGTLSIVFGWHRTSLRMTGMDGSPRGTSFRNPAVLYPRVGFRTRVTA